MRDEAIAASGPEARGDICLSDRSLLLHGTAYLVLPGSCRSARWMVDVGWRAGRAARPDMIAMATIYSASWCPQGHHRAVDVELFGNRAIRHSCWKSGRAPERLELAATGPAPVARWPTKPYGVSQLTGVMLRDARMAAPSRDCRGFTRGQHRIAIRPCRWPSEVVSGHSGGLVVKEDEIFEFRLGCGGGFGGPARTATLQRFPVMSAKDVQRAEAR